MKLTNTTAAAIAVAMLATTTPADAGTWQSIKNFFGGGQSSAIDRTGPAPRQVPGESNAQYAARYDAWRQRGMGNGCASCVGNPRAGASYTYERNGQTVYVNPRPINR